MMVSVDSTTEAATVSGPEGAALLQEVRDRLAAVELPLDLPDAAAARSSARAAAVQLDDYILPRLRSLDAPLLAVVGGSTGAGKSTLVNALVQRPVSRAGAIRPTTRQPTLVHHPADRRWFEDQRILPGLSRLTPSGEHGHVSDDGGSLLLVADSVVPRGVALLDAPDIDSISEQNRLLATQLLSAADLWLFVTTANRYADAVPWRLLAEAAARNITVAVVLDRVPPGVEEEVREDLAALLQRRGLAAARLFVVAETELDGRGMLPLDAVAPVREWLAQLAADAPVRAAIARRTLGGAVELLGAKVADVARARSEQAAAAERLRSDTVGAYRAATTRALAATEDGTLLRGEVLARWQDFVGTGEFFRSLESGIGRARDRIAAFFSGRPEPSATVETAIESGLQSVIVEEAEKAAEDTQGRWRDDPAGRQLLAGADLSGAGEGFAEKAAAQIRAWQGDLLELIRTEGTDKRFQARMLSFGVNGLGVALMIVVFAATGGLTGLEVGVAGGTAVVGQKLLEAVFGDDAVRRLARTARAGLQERTQELMDEEAQRFLDRLPDVAEGTPAEWQELRARLEELAARIGAGDAL
jgi:hypothetical protein